MAPTTTVAPTTTSTTTTTVPPAGNFVYACGTQLCLDGAPFVIKGATAYGQYTNPAGEVALAKSEGINVLELSEFDSEYQVLPDTESSATWDTVDAFVAAAGAAGMHVIFNLSEYGQSLQNAGYTPTAVDWGPYLSFIANRVNTVTGVVYKDDPTMAMIELWGEIPAPNYPDRAGTTAQLTSWFAQSETEWHALAPNILVSTGGFSYINDPGSGIDWQTIMANPSDQVCAVEVNSLGDLDTSVRNVSAYCQGLSKPWFLAAWSSCLGTAHFSGDLDHWPDDAARAADATAMYAVAAGRSPAAMPSVGADFWNLASDPIEAPGSCDIGPQVPLTAAAVAAGTA